MVQPFIDKGNFSYPYLKLRRKPTCITNLPVQLLRREQKRLDRNLPFADNFSKGRYHVYALRTVLFLLFGFRNAGPGSDVLRVTESPDTSAVVKDSRRPQRAGGFFYSSMPTGEIPCLRFPWTVTSLSPCFP